MGSRLDPVASFDQSLEELELCGSELDFPSVRRHAMGCAVEDDRTADEAAAGRDGRRRQAPEDRAHPQHELFRGEWLGEVIVGAEGQAFDAIGLVFPSRQEQHADVARLVAAPQLGEDFEAGVSRQHQIEDDEIGAFFAGRAQRVRARAGGGNAIAVFSKVIRNESRDIGLVVHDENAMWGGCCRLIRHEQAGR